MPVRSTIRDAWRRIRGNTAPPSGETASPEPAPRNAASPSNPIAEPAGAPAPAEHHDGLIRPQDVIDRFSVEALCRTADEYYRRIPDPVPLMAKPFAFLNEAPEMLENLGLLLSGLRLGTTMTVLDFGAGTCWLGRLLTQAQCRMICVDTSAAALDIGRRLFSDYPPIGGTRLEPQFVRFDGRRLELPDESVDRVICFDAFHHVPNQREVLAEFGRVLKRGGMAGFSEPGREHSRQPQSQYEMRNHQVLENDIDLDAIFALAQPAGFTSLTVKLLTKSEMSLRDYDSVFSDAPSPDLKQRFWNEAHDTTHNRSIFFLHKGSSQSDSRSHEGLAHQIGIASSEVSVRAGAPLRMTVTLTNTGTATWLNTNEAGIHGVVRLGTHLYDARRELLSVDHSRHWLPRSVAPGESLALDIEIPVPAEHDSVLMFDLVAEGVTWFENTGSRPFEVSVRPVR